MENLNTNTDYKPSYDTIKQQRDHFEERLKIEVEKREAFEKKLSSFFEPMIEKMLDDHVTNFKEDLEEKVYELESRIDDIDTEVDIRDMVCTEVNDLINDGRLSVRIELD